MSTVYNTSETASDSIITPSPDLTIHLTSAQLIAQSNNIPFSHYESFPSSTTPVAST
jgi:hypothetical protein